MKIIKELVYSLKDPTITVQQHRELTDLLTKEVRRIWFLIAELTDRKASDVREAFFLNGSYDNEYLGSFNIKTDIEFIQFKECYYTNREVSGIFADGFPTRYLWTDEEIWKKEVANYVSNNKLNYNKVKDMDSIDLKEHFKSEAKRLKLI